MNKKLEMALLSLGFVLLSGSAVYAGSGVRGAKAHKVISQSTAVNTIASGPVTIYSVVIGTGAVTDYVVLLDSANATAATAAAQVVANGYRGRIHASSATQNTNIVFDPPLQYQNGLTAINATAVMTSGITYQPGRDISGN